jgi:hypothetical protein
MPAPTGASRRTGGAAGVAEDTTGAAGAAGLAVPAGVAEDTTGAAEAAGLAVPAEDTTGVAPAPWGGAGVGTTPGGGGTRPGTGDVVAGGVAPGAPIPDGTAPAGVAVRGAAGAALSPLEEMVCEAGEEVAAEADRVPAETCVVSRTPAGGEGAMPVVVSARPAMPPSPVPPSGPPDVPTAAPPVEVEPGEDDRAATGAGRSTSAAGSSG